MTEENKDHSSEIDSISGIAKSIRKEPKAFGHFEAVVRHQFLPRCSSCASPHPLARKPKIYSNICPDCGAPSETNVKTVEIPSAMSDWRFGFGNALMKIGESLNRFAKRL